MAQGRSTKIISMIKWIQTSWLSIKNSRSLFAECLWARIQIYTVWGDAEGNTKYHKMCMAPGKP